ncbi:hypothetical protein O181_090926 [Austropuccinia psidii MF-1]|uniref:Uncharacterized protein n=1 Tax=Austropuccinia psidii MF-1 TaxID=1389203 RepID=A0A9Q3P957_9BASI|nr:hypothetical protein [Austropuccinia psidii MF-1]
MIANKHGSDLLETGLLDWARVGHPVRWDSPTGARTPSVASNPSSSPSSPGHLKMFLGSPGKRPTTPEKEFDFLDPLPSLLDGSAPSKWGPQLRKCWGAIKRNS